MTRRAIRWSLAVGAALLLVAAALTTPPTLELPSQPTVTEDDPLDLALARERVSASAYGLIDGTGKRVLWAGEAGEQRPLALVYLHGFSATRQEIAPVPERIAAALGANLFETRLAGHGRQRQPLADIRAEDWLQDGIEALAVGRRLGERVILFGTSTGATLAAALADHPDFSAVQGLVFLSPNFGVKDNAADRLTGPFGPQLARLLLGRERSWEAANAQQALYWSTRYPTAAVIEMMRLVDLARDSVKRATVPRALLVYSPSDQVISVPRALAAFDAMPAAEKARLILEGGADGSQHVLAGDILAPDNTAPLTDAVVDFFSDGCQ